MDDCSHYEDAGVICIPLPNVTFIQNGKIKIIAKYINVGSQHLPLLDATQISVVLKLTLKQSDWSTGTLTTWDVWNCSTMGPGAQSVMISGHIPMQKLPAGQ